MEDILTTLVDQPCASDSLQDSDIDIINLLRKDYYLGEFSEEATLPDGTTFNEKSKVRDNLDLYSRTEIENMVDNEHDHMLDTVNTTMQNHLNSNDPHGTKAYTNSAIRQQGQTFTTQLNSLRTSLETAIARGVVGYLKTADFETFKSNIYNTLNSELEKVYRKSKVYSKDEINILNQQFVKKNGSVPFTKPQEGIDPVLDRHLATKRYVDNVFAHVSDFLSNIEFRTWINQKLAEYAKLTDTYSRDTIDTKIENLVNSVVESAVNRALLDVLTNHIEASDPHGDRAYADGKFLTTEDLSNITTDSVPLLVEGLQSTVQEAVANSEKLWTTTSPVEKTVGYIESGTDFNRRSFTLQGIMDAIFYGKMVQISAAAETALYGSEVVLTVKVRGPKESIDHFIIKQNGTPITVEIPSSYLDENGEYQFISNFIREDTTFSVEVYYIDSADPVIDTTFVKPSYNVFVGLIYQYQRSDSVTWNDMVELVQEDNINNKLFETGLNNTVPDIEMNFNFESDSPKQILIAVPASCPSVSQMNTTSQQFGSEAFNIIGQIPLNIEQDDGSTYSMMYKYMVYKQGLVSLSTKVNFKF